MKISVTKWVGFVLFVFAGWITIPVQASILSGQILEKDVKNPVAGAQIVLETKVLPVNGKPQTGSKIGRIAPLNFSTQSDSMGNFEFSVPDGIYQFALKAVGFMTIINGSYAVTSDRKDIFYLEKQVLTLPEVVVTDNKTPKPQVSTETLSKDEMASVAGTAGDVLRALQTLPGVNGSGDYSDALIVRGGGILDNLFLLDGIPLIFPYHFGGLLSTLNSNLIKSVDFSAGGFGPEYGDYYGGLIDITQNDPRSDRWGGRVEVTPILSEAGLEGPVGSDSSFSLSGRRSYLEVFSGLLTGFDPVPSFYDYQAKYSLQISSEVHMDFQSFGSGDNLGLNLQSGFSIIPETQNLAGNNLIYHNGFDSQGVNLKWSGKDGNSITDTAYHTTFSLGVTGENYYFNLNSENFGNRFDWLHDMGPNAQLEMGFEYVHGITGSSIEMGLLPGQDDLDPFNFLYEKSEVSDYTANTDNLAFFFDQKFKTKDKKLDLSIGGRWDYQSYNHEGDPSPRLSMGYHFSDNTVLKASYGFYAQEPFLGLYSAPGFGNPNLTSEWASSAVLNLEQKVSDIFSIRLEGYNKDLSRLIELSEGTNYNNNGSGYSRGAEVFLRFYPTDRFLGWISYALSDSERRDSPNSPLHPYIYDQPNVITAVVSYKLNPGWDMGLKWHYATGSPYTPVIGSNYSYSNNDYIPVYGPEDSARLLDYMRLDFSTSFKTVYPTWSWRVFLEGWNITNYQNVETYSYNSNYTESEALTEFPILPYLGFEVTF